MSISGERASWIRSNQGAGTIIAALCAILLIYLLNQDWVYDEQRDGFRLGFFPVLGAGLMLLCALALLADRQRRATTPEMAAIRPARTGAALLGLALMGVYYVLAWNAHFSQDWLRGLLDLIPLTGEFVLWTFVFMTLGMVLLGVRPVRSAAVASAVISVVVFGLFRLIGIALPSNFLLS